MTTGPWRTSSDRGASCSNADFVFRGDKFVILSKLLFKSQIYKNLLKHSPKCMASLALPGTASITAIASRSFCFARSFEGSKRGFEFLFILYKECFRISCSQKARLTCDTVEYFLQKLYIFHGFLNGPN